MSEESIGPIVGKQRLTEAPSGLIVVQDDLTDEQRRQRREDNRTVKRSRELHRGTNKHGTRVKASVKKQKPWMKQAKAKAKAKRISKS